MKTLYLDHQVLIDESQWKHLQEIVDRGIARLVLSSWNLVELAQARDVNQRQRRVDFVASLSPVFVHDKLTLQRFELRSFIWLYFFNAGIFPFGVLSQTFADYFLMNFNMRVRPDYALADYFRNSRPESLRPVEKQQTEMINALQTLQIADRRRLNQIAEEAFARYLTSRLPPVGPDGMLLSKAIKDDITKFCFDRQATIYRLSPALAAEEAMAQKRRQNPQRRPDRGDAADLMHGVVGLAYCDVFVTRDGFARTCCDHAKTSLNNQGLRTAEIFRTLGDFLAAVDAQSTQ